MFNKFSNYGSKLFTIELVAQDTETIKYICHIHPFAWDQRLQIKYNIHTTCLCEIFMCV